MANRASAALPRFPEPPLAIAVSECLTGANVRHDGGNRRAAWPLDALGRLFRLRPVCPEVGIGMGVPRPPIRLVGDAAAPRAQGVATALDVTDALRGHAIARRPLLDAVDGYVFKARSPSCGVFAVPVHGADGGVRAPAGRGVFAAAVMRERPHLPVEEGERLFDAATREHFLMRVRVHAHWRQCAAAGVTAARLIAFHSAYKYLVMAHSPTACRRLGGLLRDLSGDVPAVAARYFGGLMEALGAPATRGGHANALAHLAGYGKRRLAGAERRELAASIERYRRGGARLATVLGALERALAAADATEALGQVYFRAYGARGGLE